MQIELDQKEMENAFKNPCIMNRQNERVTRDRKKIKCHQSSLSSLRKKNANILDPQVFKDKSKKKLFQMNDYV